MANLATIASLAELSGVLLVDKPAGVAVHDVVRTVKANFNLVKVGHGGTIPPNASGLVLVLLGDAARLGEDQMGRDMAWSFSIRLGRTTKTFDAQGETIAEKPFDGITRETFEAALAEFRGDIFQRPPQFQIAVIHGKTGYETVEKKGERAEKLHHVYRLETETFEPPIAKLAVKCTKATNLRALANDLGEALGCGASVEEARCLRKGDFAVEEAIGFMDLMKVHPADLRGLVKPMLSLRIG